MRCGRADWVSRPRRRVIPSSSIAVNADGFGWAVSPRQGHDLVARLARGEKLSLRSVIKAETMPGELETVHATIAGDPNSTQDVIISGHMYEGYLKQGANDDNSGCALTLEVGRAYINLVADGKLPKPKHTIHFLWVMTYLRAREQAGVIRLVKRP